MPNTFLGLMFLELSRTVISTCTAGVVLLVIGVLAARNDVAEARGLDRIVALSNLCFAMPLAVFSMEHFFDATSIMQLVPAYMPWRLFWAYFVGVGLLAASLSIATKILVQASGLLFGIMMFSFVAMMDIPGALGSPHDRIAWVLLCRELSFGAGGLCLAAAAMERSRGANWLATFGRVVIGFSAVFYGVEHFLHPLQIPAVPLEKVMPVWIPGRAIIDYVTGAILVVTGVGILMTRRMRSAATFLGSWVVLMVGVIYGPILIASMQDPSTAVKVEGINYFFDTLLYAGTVLAVAKAAAKLREGRPAFEQNEFPSAERTPGVAR
jgi:uncharacterized membrane protein